jgi:hypothetical protein
VPAISAMGLTGRDSVGRRQRRSACRRAIAPEREMELCMKLSFMAYSCEWLYVLQ